MSKSTSRQTAENGQSTWPANKIERRALGSLTPYPQNARTHSEAQIAQIAASMQEWGWTNPVLVDEGGTILAGHGRVLAATKLGYGHVPVIVARGWSEAQKRAYILADNQLALNAGWDVNMLKGELKGLNDWGFDLDLLGFDNLDSLLLEQGGLTDPDDVPEISDVAVSAIGDLWRLGNHQLLCGDATKDDDVAAALDGIEPHLMVTDPPYGVNYNPNWRNEANRWAGSNIKLGAAALGKSQNDDKSDWREAWHLFPGNIAYVWHAGLNSTVAAISLNESGFELRSQIIWNKTRLVIGRGNYHWQHEPCWYAVRKGTAGKWNGSRTESTIWDIPKAQISETGHSAQKPVECMRRPIENNSSIGQAVYDPFVGSGTTIIAAEMMDRVCHAIEIDPRYCDVSIKRWQAFTGKEATLAGATFAEVKAERLP